MSLACLKCGADLPGDFGVVTCSQCRAVFSIDLDGQLVSADGPAPEVDQGFFGEAAAEFEVLEEAPAQGPDQEVETPSMPEMQESLEQQPALDQNLEHANSMQRLEQEDSPVSPQNFQSSEEPTQMVTPELSLQQEVAQFAEIDSAGPLSYEVIIENLETSDLYEQALQLLLQVGVKKAETEKNVSKASLRVAKLNAAQAAVLQKRLLGRKLKVTWRQHVFSADKLVDGNNVGEPGGAEV